MNASNMKRMGPVTRMALGLSMLLPAGLRHANERMDYSRDAEQHT
jgi:hypothetical protein